LVDDVWIVSFYEQTRTKKEGLVFLVEQRRTVSLVNQKAWQIKRDPSRQE
jgi:hypothetical protein